MLTDGFVLGDSNFRIFASGVMKDKQAPRYRFVLADSHFRIFPFSHGLLQAQLLQSCWTENFPL